MRKAISLFLCGLLGAAAQQPDMTPTFKTQSNLVVVNIFVRDKNGNPINNLKKSDFTLLENGVPQPISVFEFQKLNLQPAPGTPASIAASGQPQTLKTRPEAPTPTTAARFRDRRLIVLYFDFTSLGPTDQVFAQKAALKFINEQLTASDLVQIMSFSAKLNVDQEFTDDRDLLISAIKKFRIGESSDFAADGNVSDSSDADPNDAFSADESEFNIFNTDRKLSGLESAAKMLAALPEKKALIYFSGGISRTGVENESQLRSTVNAAVRSNVSFYTIDVRGLDATPPGGDAGTASPRGTALYTGATQTGQRTKFHSQQETISTLAADTGGKALLDNNDLTMGIRQAQQDIQSYYTLGYYSTNTALDGKFRRVQVKLANYPQAKLDYRSGYFGEKDFRAFNSTDKEKQLEDALMLGDPMTDLTLALEVDYFRLSRDRYFIPVAVKIPGTQIPLAKKGKSETTQFDFIGQVRDAKGALVTGVRDAVTIKLPEADAGQLSQKSLTYDTGFTLPAGEYKLKLLVRENQTGKMGTFETTFRAPDPGAQKGQLEISSVVWSSQREPLQAAIGSAEKQKKLLEQHPLVQDGQKLVPSVTKVFRKNQNLYVYLEVYDPGMDPTANRPSIMATVGFYRGKAKAFESSPVEISRTLPTRPNTVPLQLQLPLKSLTPGRYICQINVIDELGRKFALERTAVVLAP